MMHESKVLLRLHREVKRLTYSSRDVIKRDGYADGRISGMAEAIEIINELAWKANAKERRLRYLARHFTAAYLFGRIICIHDYIKRGNNYEAGRLCEGIINRGTLEKGTQS